MSSVDVYVRAVAFVGVALTEEQFSLFLTSVLQLHARCNPQKGSSYYRYLDETSFYNYVRRNDPNHNPNEVLSLITYNDNNRNKRVKTQHSEDIFDDVWLVIFKFLDPESLLHLSNLSYSLFTQIEKLPHSYWGQTKLIHDPHVFSAKYNWLADHFLRVLDLRCFQALFLFVHSNRVVSCEVGELTQYNNADRIFYGYLYPTGTGVVIGSLQVDNRQYNDNCTTSAKEVAIEKLYNATPTIHQENELMDYIARLFGYRAGKNEKDPLDPRKLHKLEFIHYCSIGTSRY
jgi:hypothetical protein